MQTAHDFTTPAQGAVMAPTDDSYWPEGFELPMALPTGSQAPPQRITPATVSADGKLHLGGLAEAMGGDLPAGWSLHGDGDWLVLARCTDDTRALTTRWDKRGAVTYPYLRLTKAHSAVAEALPPLTARGSARQRFTVERMVTSTELWLRLLWRA